MKNYNIIVILGATATGKTRLAANLAALINTEIISADSRQVYRDMNMGTGKDLNEYVVNEVKIPYHLIDLVAAGGDYHLHAYLQDFKKAYEYITGQKKIPILCGGTGMYIDAVLKGFEYTGIPVDQDLRNQLQPLTLLQLQETFQNLPPTPYHLVADTSTAKRTLRAIEIATWLGENEMEKNNLPELHPILFGLSANLESRRKRIELRLKQRLDNGLVDEVKQLLINGVPAEKLLFYGLEYKFIVKYLNNEITYNYLVEHLTIAIQQFAKRQMTYFRKMEDDGFKINWINADTTLEEQLEVAKGLL